MPGSTAQPVGVTGRFVRYAVTFFQIGSMRWRLGKVKPVGKKSARVCTRAPSTNTTHRKTRLPPDAETGLICRALISEIRTDFEVEH